MQKVPRKGDFPGLLPETCCSEPIDLHPRDRARHPADAVLITAKLFSKRTLALVCKDPVFLSAHAEL